MFDLVELFREYSSVISDATYPHSEPLRAENAIWLTMPRLFNMMDYLQPCSHLQCKTGWTKCLLYQKGIDEELSCTTEAKPIITGAGGKTLADTLLGFCKIDYLPKLNCRCGPHGRWWWRAYFIFKRNSVKWHDSCRQSLTAPSFVEQRRWKHHVRTLQWCSRSTPGRV